MDGNIQNHILQNKLLNTKETINEELTEKDFYPPVDNRVLYSHIREIYGDKNFERYAKYIFDLYEKENYYEN